MSKGARRVVKHLGTYGIIIERAEEFYQIDIACSMWFPNHIIQVIDKCLKGGNRSKKLFKAQETGWHYFSNPIVNMLVKREEAYQPTCPDQIVEEGFIPEYGAAIYGVVTTLLLAHDINNTELNQLLYDVPPLKPSKEVMMEVIRICKERNARSIPYLHGILERRVADLKARLRERDESKVEVWEPEEIIDRVDAKAAAASFRRLFKIMKSWKDTNETK